MHGVVNTMAWSTSILPLLGKGLLGLCIGHLSDRFLLISLNVIWLGLAKAQHTRGDHEDPPLMHDDE